jgi:hypothetical protein
MFCMVDPSPMPPSTVVEGEVDSRFMEGQWKGGLAEMD